MMPETYDIASGWRPGLVGWTVARHGAYYAEHWNFGPEFEAKVAREMGAFVDRLGAPGTHLFSASDAQGYLATLTVDGGEQEAEHAHLRWFIASDRARGLGLGQRLMARAIQAARKDQARGLYLHTFKGLEAARKVYLNAGFTITDEAEDATWGTRVTEQHYALTF
ncbi:MAG: GNAT family N-acetyltransferase [Pseudomonadota bacterium]